MAENLLQTRPSLAPTGGPNQLVARLQKTHFRIAFSASLLPFSWAPVRPLSSDASRGASEAILLLWRGANRLPIGRQVQRAANERPEPVRRSLAAQLARPLGRGNEPEAHIEARTAETRAGCLQRSHARSLAACERPQAPLCANWAELSVCARQVAHQQRVGGTRAPLTVLLCCPSNEG